MNLCNIWFSLFKLIYWKNVTFLWYCYFLSFTSPLFEHRHFYYHSSLCRQRTEQLRLVNKLICRRFCSLLFSFNKVLLCYCYSVRENVKKHPKLLRHSLLLTDHASYCCVHAIIAQLCESTFASMCGLHVKFCAFVLLRLPWQAGRCKWWGATKKLPLPWI